MLQLSGNLIASEQLKQQFLEAQAAGKIYDYEKELYGNKGLITNSVISVSGGNEKTSLYFSAASKDDDEIDKITNNEAINRFVTGVNLDATLLKSLSTN